MGVELGYAPAVDVHRLEDTRCGIRTRRSRRRVDRQRRARVAALLGHRRCIYLGAYPVVDAGTDLGSGSVVPVRAPRVAVRGGAPVQGTSFGFTWKDGILVFRPLT